MALGPDTNVTLRLGKMAAMVVSLLLLAACATTAWFEMQARVDRVEAKANTASLGATRAREAVAAQAETVTTNRATLAQLTRELAESLAALRAEVRELRHEQRADFQTLIRTVIEKEKP